MPSPTRKTSPRVVSLFAGCGGLDLGFHEAGFRTIYAVDNDPAAIKVYSHNIAKVAHLRDVRQPLFHEEVKQLTQCDVVLGGFPCQGFSKAGPKKESDARNSLYLEMLSAVKQLRPSIFIAENVDGLSQNFGGSYLRAIVEDFTKIGYRVQYKIIDAVSYGAPQHRRRIVFAGVRCELGEFEWPEETHIAPQRNGEKKLHSDSHGKNKALTIKVALRDLPKLGQISDHLVTNNWPKNYKYIFTAIGEGQKLCNVRHAPSSVYTWEIPEVFGETTPKQRLILETIGKHRRLKKYGNIPNGNPLPLMEIEKLAETKIKSADINYLLDKGYLKEIDGKYDLKGAMFCSGLFKRPDLNQPSPTVLTNFNNPRYFLHPLEDRPFSLRECARLQGFPDNFEFSSADISLEDGYRLVGNAVPPPLSRALAKSVAVFLKKKVEIKNAA